jgi:hypothetical protein
VQLAKIRDGLRLELGDTHDALKGEQEARAAASEELHARLAAKERAEEEKEAAEARFLAVERQYLAMVDELTRAQDRANAEVRTLSRRCRARLAATLSLPHGHHDVLALAVRRCPRHDLQRSPTAVAFVCRGFQGFG